MFTLSRFTESMITKNGEVFHSPTGDITGLLHDSTLSLPLSTLITTGNELKRQSETDRVYLVTDIARTANRLKATVAKATHTVTVKRLSGGTKDTFGRGTSSYTTIYSMPIVMEGNFKTPAKTAEDRLINETKCSVLVSDSYQLKQTDILEFQSGNSFKTLDIVSPITGINKINLLLMSA